MAGSHEFDILDGAVISSRFLRSYKVFCCRINPTTWLMKEES